MRTTIKTSKTLQLAAVAVLGILPLSALRAGTDMSKTPAPVAPAPETPFVTGNLTINYETAFVSNGFDVWGTGNNWDNWFIHPSIELDFQLTKDLQFYANTWWDVNDQAESNIGKNIQEVDVNVGFYYTLGKMKFQLGYGDWNYASQVESVIDFRATYGDGMWNPFIALHGRIDAGAGLGCDKTGLLVQVGFAPSKTWGALTVSLPITVDFDTTKSYVIDGSDSGFGFVSAGLSLSYAVTKQISINLGATYYHTESGVFPTNPSDNFVTGLAGFTITF